jgi:uncharacterized membrane protein
VTLKRIGFGIIAAMLFSATEAGAQTTGLYTVTNVAPDDSLNVRSGAGAGFQDLGDIAYNAQVRVIGFNADGNWAEIPWQTGTAWVSAHFLELLQADGAVLPTALRCGGTEPFWNADITPDAVAFEMLGEPATTATIDWAAPPRGRPADYIVGFSAPPFTGVLRKDICSDGMSDIDYPWSVVLINLSGTGAQVVEGCCGY